MATFSHFQDFAEQLGKGVHNLDTHTLKVYLSNATPNAATHTVKTDLADITNQFGYDGPADIANGYTETSGTGTLTGTDKTWTASGGTFGPFRYVIFYNDDATSPLDALIGWWDYGSPISCNDGESFTVNFGASVMTIAQV
jgi:hypothetical protein